MEAQIVWTMWRRILREPALAEWVLSDTPADGWRAAEVSADELAVLRAYADSKVSTRFFIENYRFRLSSSALNALEAAGPLTRRAAAANDLDLDAMLEDLLESTGWRDFGPHVYTFGQRILEYLDSRPEIAAITGMRDLIRLELAATAVIMAAADSPADDVWSPSATRWRVNPWLRLVTCELDLANWLKTPADLGRVSPTAGPRQFAVYLPSLDARPKIVALPRAAGELLARLAEQGQPTVGKQEEDEQILTELGRLGLLWPSRC